MTKRLYSYDPLSGTRSYVDYNEADDSITFYDEADVTALLEWNRRLYNEAPTGWNEGASVASMHPLLRHKLKQAGILDDPKAISRFLNDPDNRAWRIRPGRV